VKSATTEKRPVKGIRNIFFDLDNTLFRTREHAEEARRTALQAMVEHGLRIPAKQFHRACSILEESVEEYTYYERFLFGYFLTRCEHEFKLKLSNIRKAILAAAGFLQYDSIMDAKMSLPYCRTVLQDLSSMGYRLGLITNGEGIYQAYKIIRLNLDHIISPDLIFISNEIGVRKPNPRIFNLVCEELNILPKNCCYVGDSYQNDIVPAHKAGFFTIHCCYEKGAIKRYGQIKPDRVIHDINDLLDIFSAKRRCPHPIAQAPRERSQKFQIL